MLSSASPNKHLGVGGGGACFDALGCPLTFMLPCAPSVLSLGRLFFFFFSSSSSSFDRFCRQYYTKLRSTCHRGIRVCACLLYLDALFRVVASFQVGRNERINYAKGLLQREFLPHVGVGAGTEAKKVRGVVLCACFYSLATHEITPPGSPPPSPSLHCAFPQDTKLPACEIQVQFATSRNLMIMTVFSG